MKKKADIKTTEAETKKKRENGCELKKNFVSRSSVFKKLVSKGSRQGFLTLNEITKAFANEIFSQEQMEQIFLTLENFNIEIVEKKKNKTTFVKKKASKASSMDFGSVTDPVKMYLREMGLVTLLSREDEVFIAKKIENGEQNVLKALIGTSIGVNEITELGEKVRNEGLRTRYILKDIDEADAYALPRYCKVLSHLFKCMIRLFAYSETHPDNLFLPGRQCRKDLPGLLRKIYFHCGIGGEDKFFVFNEISQVAVLLLSDRSFKGYRLPCDFHHFPNFFNRYLHLRGYLLRRRLPPKFLNKIS